MYEFIKKEDLHTACRIKRGEEKRKKRDEALNKMREEISQFLAEQMEQAKTAGYVSYCQKIFEIPEFFYDKTTGRYIPPKEIIEELAEAGFMYEICHDDRGKYYLH